MATYFHQLGHALLSLGFFVFQLALIAWLLKTLIEGMFGRKG